MITQSGIGGDHLRYGKPRPKLSAQGPKWAVTDARHWGEYQGMGDMVLAYVHGQSKLGDGQGRARIIV